MNLLIPIKTWTLVCHYVSCKEKDILLIAELQFLYLILNWIIIIKVFRTIVFIFIVISTTFRPVCPPAFFRCLLNSRTFTELRTTSFIESTRVACSDSVSHNRVQELSIPVLLLACSCYFHVVKITIRMKTIVRKPLMIKIIKLRLRNLDNWIGWFNPYWFVTWYP